MRSSWRARGDSNTRPLDSYWASGEAIFRGFREKRVLGIGKAKMGMIGGLPGKYLWRTFAA